MIRDCEGEVLGACVSKHLDLHIRLWWKLKLWFVLLSLRMRNIVEGDALTVIKKLQTKESDLSSIGNIISKAKLKV